MNLAALFFALLDWSEVAFSRSAAMTDENINEAGTRAYPTAVCMSVGVSAPVISDCHVARSRSAST